MTMTSSGIDTTYNGWANFETWNVALYIQNDYALYCLARDWVEDRFESGYDDAPYSVFRHTLKYASALPTKTPDGVRWDDPTLDTNELDEMLAVL